MFERQRSGGRWGAVLSGVLAGTLLATGSTAQAADLSIPIDTGYGSGVAVGQEVELASVGAADLAGRQCAVSAVRRDSATDVNSGNDIVVSSGASSVTLSDVEREAGAETAGDELVLGERIVVVLVMGPDEEFAAELDVRFECAPPPPAAGGDPSATNEPMPSTAPAVLDGDLPATGDEAVALTLLGVGLTALGAGLVIAARRPVIAVAEPTGRRRSAGRTSGWARRDRR